VPFATLIVPGSLATRTGGYIYDRRMVEGLRRLGWSMDVVEVDSSFPYPTDGALEATADALEALPADALVIVDSLALGAMPDLVVRAAARLRFVALVHLPLGADCTCDAATGARFAEAEQRALNAVRLVVVTGAAALPLLAAYGLSRNRTIVVEPGTDRAPLARGSGTGPAVLLSVATLHPGKGHHSLLTALANIRDLDWQLVCAGSLTRHPQTANHVRALAADLKLAHRVSLVGDLDPLALADAYDRADLFVSASRQETYGMALAEALARGLPVVATTTGAAAELVGEAAGVLVPVDDAPALAAALTRVLGDGGLRARLAAGARHVRDRLPDWDQASARMAQALRSLDAHD
jgi:glycosyltransferase involved in cell wall biosynthesis